MCACILKMLQHVVFYWKVVTVHLYRNIDTHCYIAELARAEASQIEEQRAFATIGRTYFCQAESIVNDDESYKSSLLNAKKSYKKSLDLCER